MIQRNPYKSVVALVLTVALALTGVVALVETVPVRAQSVDANGAATFQVSAQSSGYSFSPTTIENLASGTNVTVTFSDLAPLSHSFTIYGRQGVVIPTSTDSGTLLHMIYGSGYKPLVDINLSGLQSMQVTFAAPPSPGWYEFVCNQVGHFEEGMYGFIAFGEALPSNLSVSSPNTGPGAAVFIIVGTIVSLVVIAIVLGFVVGRRRSSIDEMPPERLGYPEPSMPEPAPPPTGQGPPKG
jgi:plastocyanin